MRNSVHFLNALLSSDDDAITIINEQKEVIFWNDSASKMYKIEAEHVLNRHITDFFHTEELMILKVLKEKEPVLNSYHQPQKNKHVVVNALPVFDDTETLIGAVAVERDVSQLVKLNHNLENTSAELNELRERLNTSNEETPFSTLKGSSKKLQQTIQVAYKAARTDATTLVLGESGTGKEIFARAIHDASQRSNGPFIPVNCGAIPEALFESELFGYEGGSFTGAEKRGKAGKIELADGGTLFLDEVGELPLEMQVKLLRSLQENTVYRIGDSKGRDINIRFIAATNQNLEKLMDENKFRSDLYYRLNVIQLTLPPLRDRAGDIEELADNFLSHFAVKYQVPVPEMDKEAFHVLLQYHWPGNIRELRNLMERIVILNESSFVTKEDMVSYLPTATEINFHPAQHEVTTLPKEKEQMEKQLIEKTLSETNGNKSDTAKRLGISRVTLYNKLKKFQIDKR